MKRGFVAAMAILLTASVGSGFAEGTDLRPLERLGKLIFEDDNLSIRKNQSCATCHGANWGGTGPDSAINAAGSVYEGSIPGRFGNRKPPSVHYSDRSPILHTAREVRGPWVGGHFWDGRATGEKLGKPVADQAQGPFLNPAEQALPDAACVVYLVSVSEYADRYREVWGDEISTIGFSPDVGRLCQTEGSRIALSEEDRAKVEIEYGRIAQSIAAYEGSAESNPFSSKFDAWKAGRAELTPLEKQGFELFEGEGRCARCHVSGGTRPLFTDFSYDNLGAPPNPRNPVLKSDPDFRDLGLGGFLKARGEPKDVYRTELGKMKVPTLRNVDRRPTADSVKAYFHNGVFKSLKDVVHFYNTRDVMPQCEDIPDPEWGVNCWPAPEVPENVNADEMGALGLTEEEEDAIVAFLKTLSDGYAPPGEL